MINKPITIPKYPSIKTLVNLATTAPTKVAKERIASNKASTPLPFKASLLTCLLTLVKYNPNNILTNMAPEMIYNDKSS